LTFLCALIEVSGPGDDKPASVEVEVADKKVEAPVEVVAVGGEAVTAEAFLAHFFAAHFTRSFLRVDLQTGGDAMVAGLVPKIFLKPVLK
jgi:hypothetical protein